MQPIPDQDAQFRPEPKITKKKLTIEMEINLDYHKAELNDRFGDKKKVIDNGVKQLIHDEAIGLFTKVHPAMNGIVTRVYWRDEEIEKTE